MRSGWLKLLHGEANQEHVDVRFGWSHATYVPGTETLGSGVGTSYIHKLEVSISWPYHCRKVVLDVLYHPDVSAVREFYQVWYVCVSV